MKTKREDRDKVRYKMIAIRLTDEEKKLLQEKSDINGLSMSSYIRTKILPTLIKDND